MCQPRPEDWFWRFVLSPRRQLTRQGVAPVARLRAPVASPLKANDLNQGLTNRFKPSMSSSMVVPPTQNAQNFIAKFVANFLLKIAQELRAPVAKNRSDCPLLSTRAGTLLHS